MEKAFSNGIRASCDHAAALLSSKSNSSTMADAVGWVLSMGPKSDYSQPRASAAAQGSTNELSHLAAPILWACRSTNRYRLGQSRQIHAVPKSDQPALCGRETLDAMSYLVPVCEKSDNARQHHPQTRG